MTPIKYKTALDAQPAIARKLFEFVPIQDAWPANKIIGEMIRSGLPRIDFKTVEGCMNRLKDAGLVKEPERGTFQRIAPREREAPKLQLQVCAAPAPEPIAERCPGPVIEGNAPTIVLGEMATTLRRYAGALTSLADELDESAVGMEERIDHAERRLSKFRELSALLKEF